MRFHDRTTVPEFQNDLLDRQLAIIDAHHKDFLAINAILNELGNTPAGGLVRLRLVEEALGKIRAIVRPS